MTVATPRLFGTDGIRAPFGTFPLDRATVVRLGRCLGDTLASATADPLVVLGGDTRASTPTLCRWLAGGLAAAGARVCYLGTVPTPAVAAVVRDLGSAGGVAVSASHNLAPDNGVKLFDGAGRKWSSAAEAALEARLGEAAGALPPLPEVLPVEPAAVALYTAFLAQTLPPDRPLAGLRVVLDTAHGATVPFAATAFSGHGARVATLGDQPDGENINRGCGSTDPAALAAAVRSSGSDFGVAFDGDGDRAILVDEEGVAHDGDDALFLWASDLAEQGLLVPRAVVATTMSNLGLTRALASRGIGVVRCPVGDRAVVEAMEDHGILLGGEQSGHLVHRGLTTTGDGLVTALHLAHVVRRAGTTLSGCLGALTRFPQLLRNVPVPSKPPLEELPEVVEAARKVERALGGEGRLVLRYSGTEPLARIMLEGPDGASLERFADAIAEAIEAAVGRGAP